MTTVLAVLLMIAIGAGAVFYVPRFFVMRAMREIVLRFRAKGALSAKTATTLESLGLGPKALLDRMFRLRDYKPMALRLMVQADIIRMTEEGLYYLSEAELERSTVKDMAKLD